MEKKNQKDLIVTLSVLLVIVFLVTGVLISNKQKISSANGITSSLASNVTTDTSQKTASDTANTTTTPAVANSGFKDGTYTATSEYATPSDTENIKVIVILKDGVVIDTSATASASSRDSRYYASQFVQNYKPYVVGKNIVSINLSRLSGSSLTSQGFNDAIAQITTQAKS